MDETLRRRARALEPDDVAARARWLADAVRAGELHRSRVELLAHLGDEAGRAVVRSAEVDDVGEWAAQFACFGSEVGSRVARVLARLAEAELFGSFLYPDTSSPARPWLLQRAHHLATIAAEVPGSTSSLLRAASSMLSEVCAGRALRLAVHEDLAKWVLEGRGALVDGDSSGPEERLCSDCLYADELLPAIVLGTTSSVRTSPPQIEIHHQHGGYACLQTTLTGLVLPLESNIRQLGPHGDRILWILHALGPANALPGALADTLGPMAFTAGQDYATSELHELSEVLGPFLPPLRLGGEALVQFAEVRLEDFFLGWRVADAVRGIDPPPQTFHRHVFDDSRVVDEEMLSGLRSHQKPRAYLLWNNTD
ncbi:MAG: hypothetical protein ACAI25_03135 [Planctomycetota bacterium]